MIEVLLLAGEAFPAGFTGSVFRFSRAPVADWTATIAQNGTVVGSVTVAAGATTGTFTAASAVTFAADGLLTLTCPAIQDTAASSPSFVLIGAR